MAYSQYICHILMKKYGKKEKFNFLLNLFIITLNQLLRLFLHGY